MGDGAEPAVSYQHLEDTPFVAMKSQQHGDRKVSVWLRLLVERPDRSINHTRYDPGLVLERHGEPVSRGSGEPGRRHEPREILRPGLECTQYERCFVQDADAAAGAARVVHASILPFRTLRRK